MENVFLLLDASSHFSVLYSVNPKDFTENLLGAKLAIKWPAFCKEK